MMCWILDDGIRVFRSMMIKRCGRSKGDLKQLSVVWDGIPAASRVLFINYMESEEVSTLHYENNFGLFNPCDCLPSARSSGRQTNRVASTKGLARSPPPMPHSHLRNA